MPKSKHHYRSPPLVNADIQGSESRYSWDSQEVRIIVSGHPVEKINGEYLSDADQIGKDALYKMVPNEEFCVHYSKLRKSWCICRLEHVETENKYALCKTKSKYPFLLEDNEIWLVYDPSSKGWAKADKFLLRAYDALNQEEDVAGIET